jgi:aspartate/methionine/tyrosine aminotransferase
MLVDEGGRLHTSKRAQSIEPSPIRKIIDLSESRPDIIGLHAGEPDFTTPSHIVEAGVRSLRDGYTHYTHGAGILQLREAIARKLLEENGIEANPKTEITVTAGGFAAIFAITHATLDPGDEVLILQPSWPSYSGFVQLAGGVPVPVSLQGPDFEPSQEMMEHHTTEKTRMIVINSPNNPTGSVYSRDCLSSLAEFAQDHDMLAVSDEVYEKIVFDGNEHFSVASRPEFKDSMVTVNSFSKTYAMTGWRVGYVIANESITTSIRKIHGYMVSCAPSDAQRAALGALLGPQDCVNEMVGEYAARRDRIVKGLDEVEGFRCVAPKGTFYAFPDVSRLNIPSAEIANKLLEEAKVASIPGSAFGAAGEGYLRFSFATSQQNIEEGISRVKAWRSKCK